MTTDIRIGFTFKGHAKRRKIKIILGESGTDYLIDLWISTAENHPTGVLKGMDHMDIALASGWDKDPEIFISALLKCRLLDKREDGDYEIHAWSEHQPWVIGSPERQEKARNAAIVRWGKNDKNKQEEKQDVNATSMLQAMPQEHATNYFYSFTAVY